GMMSTPPSRDICSGSGSAGSMDATANGSSRVASSKSGPLMATSARSPRDAHRGPARARRGEAFRELDGVAAGALLEIADRVGRRAHLGADLLRALAQDAELLLDRRHLRLHALDLGGEQLVPAPGHVRRDLLPMRGDLLARLVEQLERLRQPLLPLVLLAAEEVGAVLLEEVDDALHGSLG